MPPKKLDFDATRVKVLPKRYEPKNIPEHLVKPEINYEKVARVKAFMKAKAKNVVKRKSPGTDKANATE